MAIKSPLGRQLGTQFDSVFDVVKSNPMYDKTGGKIPSLDLNFAKSKSLRDSRSTKNLINFTRASIGTYVDSDGLIKSSPVNLLTYSEQFDQWTVAGNSILTPNAIAAPDGTLTADGIYFATTGATNVSQNVTLTQDKNYTFSVYAKAVTPGSNNKFTPYINSTTPKSPTDPFEATSEWVRFSYTFTHTNPSASVGVFILNKGDTYITNVYFWGAQLEEGTTATDYIPTGATKSGAPRFDHDPVTGESLGLLIEEQRTNYTYNSNIVDGSNLGTTILSTLESVVSPRGIVENVRKLDMGSGNSVWRFGAASASAPDRNYAISFWVKLASGTSSHFHVDINDRTPSTNQVHLNITNEWQRYIAIGGLRGDTAGHRFADINLTSQTVNPIYVWGAQIEAAEFVTSYIPTDTSYVTRSPDLTTIEGTNFTGGWYNQSEGTIFSDISPLDTSSGRGYLFSNGSNGQRIGHNTNSTTGFALFVFKNTITSLSTAVSGMPKPIKTCLAYKPGSSRGVIDGDLKTLSTTSDIPNAIDQVGLGVQNFGTVSGFLNGHISRLAYFPTRLPDDKLKSITT